MVGISGKPLVVDVVSGCGKGFSVAIVDSFVFLFEESGPELAYELVLSLFYEGQIISIHRFNACTSEICRELILQCCSKC
jgi:hypothetical protein